MEQSPTESLLKPFAETILIIIMMAIIFQAVCASPSSYAPFHVASPCPGSYCLCTDEEMEMLFPSVCWPKSSHCWNSDSKPSSPSKEPVLLSLCTPGSLHVPSAQNNLPQVSSWLPPSLTAVSVQCHFTEICPDYLPHGNQHPLPCYLLT